MQCCDPENVLFQCAFDPRAGVDPLEVIDGSPLSAHFDAIIPTEEMSHPILMTIVPTTAVGIAATAALGLLTALNVCLNQRLEFAIGIIQTGD